MKTTEILPKTQWALLTSTLQKESLAFKTRPTDFFVEEIPQYLPGGEGEHVYLLIEKEKLTTHQAINRLSSELKIKPQNFGMAGLKDAFAVTRQWVSILHADVEKIKSLTIPGIKFIKISRHANKLRHGHLKGNFFKIKLRGEISNRTHFDQALQTLSTRGLPNYFGPQRFGMRGDNHLVGKALLQSHFDHAVKLIAGLPRKEDSEKIFEARTHFENSNYESASRCWPHGFDQPKRLCRLMKKEKGNAKRAFFGMGKETVRFYLSAYQSWLFNQYLSKRIESFDRFMEGDLAFKHDSGAVFRIENIEAEELRREKFEISPSGPLFGYKMTSPIGPSLALEDFVLTEEGIDKNFFAGKGIRTCKGARRALRVCVSDLSQANGCDDLGDYLELSFSLPSGSFATSLLREVTNTCTMF